MSSFNTYDNYNSFIDLINRTEVLEEKTYKAMVKGANLGPELKKFRTEDGKGLSATSRIKNLILISALVQMDLLDDDVAKTLKRKATSSSYITNTLKDLAPKVHAQLFDGDNPGSEEVVKYVQDNIDQLLPFAVKNVTRGEYEKTEVDTEVPDDAEAKELEDEVSAEVRLAKGLIDQEADKVDLPFDDVDVNIEALDNKEEVAAKIVELINTTNNLKAEQTGVGFNVEGPIGVFGSEDKVLDQMNRLITKFFPAVREAEIRVTLNTDNREEDYEEGPEPMEPEGPANEYEEGINEVEDEESNFKFSVGSVGGQHGQIMTKDKTFDSLEDACNHAGVNVGDCISGEWDDMGDGTKEYVVDEDTVIIMHAASEDNELDDFDIGPQSDENIPDDYEEVLAALVDDDKKKHAMKQLNGEDEEGDFTKSRVLVAFAPEHSPEEMQANVDRYLAAAKKLGVKAKAGKIDDEVAEVYVDGGPASKEMKILGDLQRDMLQATGYFGGEDEEERIVMQPMLETRKTDTSVYLTEQSASDKRNKKSEVKNQSFKERYKPKTHWQLEELRRYGL